MKRTWDELCDRLGKQAKEIERLKKALKQIIFCDGGERVTVAYDIAKQALKEGE